MEEVLEGTYLMSSDRNRFIHTLYKSGRSYREIGEVFNISRQRVQQVVHKEKRRAAKHKLVRESREHEDLRVARWLNTNDLWK